MRPRTRGEGEWFRSWIPANGPQWTEAIRLSGERIGDVLRVWSVLVPIPASPHRHARRDVLLAWMVLRSSHARLPGRIMMPKFEITSALRRTAPGDWLASRDRPALTESPGLVRLRRGTACVVMLGLGAIG